MSTQHPSIVSSGPADDEPEPQRSVFDTYAFAIIQGALLAAAVSFERQAWSLFMKRPQGPTTGPAESRRQLEAVVLTAEGATFRAMHDAAKAGDIEIGRAHV